MTWRLGVVLVLTAKKQLEVFNPAEHKNDDGTKSPDDEHRFENSGHSGDEHQTHKQTMLFETRQVDQFRSKNGVATGLCPVLAGQSPATTQP